jgi:formylmethanofuran dehydrogenase subunit A
VTPDLLIAGGSVYDPANGINGEVRDLWISSGRIAAPPTDPSVRAARTLNAHGYVIFPGGVDMHSHIAGPKVNAARKLQPGNQGYPVGSTIANGLGYAGLGFTTVFDAAVPGLFARQAHLELNDTPIIDKGFLTLVGNHHLVMDAVRDGDRDRLDEILAWLVSAVGAFGFKAVNPGGTEAWKRARHHRLSRVDENIPGWNITPSDIVREVSASVDRLQLSHPFHIHCNDLGSPGNSATTLATMESLQGRRGHLAHMQFHSYRGRDETDLASDVPRLAEFLSRHQEISIDVGHVSFGPSTALTGDGPLGAFLARLTGNKWVCADTECETGCGVVPIEYKYRSLFHSVQWAIGLEWYLLSPDPWRTAFSTDHPNGGTFLRYPETIRLLMDRPFRREMLAKAHPELPRRCQLADIDRELTFSEIAILTGAAPARILGLNQKGHLGVGADADITIYQPHSDIAHMFSFPRYVIKGGNIVIDDGDIQGTPMGSTYVFDTGRDSGGLTSFLTKWFQNHYSISMNNYLVDHQQYIRQKDSVTSSAK